MRIAIRSVLVTSALMTVGCAHANARHDLFEQIDIRIENDVDTARRTCRAQQPKAASPSASEYERCLLEQLQRVELAAEAVG